MMFVRVSLLLWNRFEICLLVTCLSIWIGIPFWWQFPIFGATSGSCSWRAEKIGSTRSVERSLAVRILDIDLEIW